MERSVTLDTLKKRCTGKVNGQYHLHSRIMLTSLFLFRFFRRGWVTFDRSVNIKEICWNLQNIRVSTGSRTALRKKCGFLCCTPPNVLFIDCFFLSALYSFILPYFICLVCSH